MDKETITIEPVKEKGGYSVTISPHIHKRLERHIFIIKKLINKNLTKNNWLLSAIEEKLEREVPYQDVPAVNTISLKLDPKREQLILQRVNYVRKFRKSYSKKQWILDAITDKLERDEENVEKKLLETRHDQGLSDKQQIELLKNELA